MEIIYFDNVGGSSTSGNRLLAEFASYQKSAGSDYSAIVQRVSRIDPQSDGNHRNDEN